MRIVVGKVTEAAFITHQQRRLALALAGQKAVLRNLGHGWRVAGVRSLACHVASAAIGIVGGHDYLLRKAGLGIRMSAGVTSRRSTLAGLGSP